MFIHISHTYIYWYRKFTFVFNMGKDDDGIDGGKERRILYFCFIFLLLAQRSFGSLLLLLLRWWCCCCCCCRRRRHVRVFRPSFIRLHFVFLLSSSDSVVGVRTDGQKNEGAKERTNAADCECMHVLNFLFRFMPFSFVLCVDFVCALFFLFCFDGLFSILSCYFFLFILLRSLSIRPCWMCFFFFFSWSFCIFIYFVMFFFFVEFCMILVSE